MKGEPKISFNELMREVAKYKKISNAKRLYYEEEIAFIKAARKKGMTYSEILVLWKKAGFSEDATKSTIARLARLIAAGEEVPLKGKLYNRK